ncbi:AraC family transcriptional regulator [Paenibacillus sacheonensis]|uniref:Helix-turn-helix domain-containing protein n=1 Tax=Paenibacillus sacheonensis TaxID=742054 RepID=A0A7X4YU29_9BACL|nr:AraC family transcriptional regulator [Paenibacillus sacheonensis]MBM7568904.1 AraC-like DNA-binding protein [Paenibacillus sacheonensis]NBC72605.1 helix-turn-helix domain-containing protein [Paenibacillus sacheonensis]
MVTKHLRFQSGYAKVYASIAVVIVSIGLILSTALYYNFNNTASRIIQTYTKDQLSLIKYSTNLMFDNARYTLMQYNTNPAALKLLNYENMDQIEINELQRQIQAVNINMPYETNIYIYNRKANAFYYNRLVYRADEFPDQDIVNRLNGKVKKLAPIARSMPTYEAFKKETNRTEDVYTFVYYEGNPEVIPNAIILNLSNNWLKDTIRSMDSSISKEVIVTDASGEVILGNETYRYLDRVDRNPAFGAIFGGTNRAASGYWIGKLDGRKVLISYATSDVLDWKYIRITPYGQITDRIKSDLLATSLIVIGVVLLFLLIAYLIANNLFGAFRKYVAELERRFTSDKNKRYEAKQAFLRRLTEPDGRGAATQAQFDAHGIPFRTEDSFELVLVRIDRFREQDAPYTSRDKELFAYGLINLMNELAAASPFRGEAFALGEHRIALLLNGKFDDFESSSAAAADLIRSILEQAERVLRLKLSAAAGDILEDVSEIPYSVAECADAMNYRIFDGPGSVLYVSRLRELNKEAFKVPEAEVDRLTSLLLLGKREEAIMQIRGLLDGARLYPFAYLQLTVLQIAISLKEGLDRKNGNPSLVKMDHFFDIAQHLSRYESLGVLADELVMLGDALMAEIQHLQDKKTDRTSQRLSEILALVEQEYAKPGINPDEIAQRFDISAEYLRKLFKSATGESLSEHINKVRLDKAKELLANTDESIQEIAVRTGFSNTNYFYSLFKKHSGITPSEYRNLNK